MRNHTRNGRVYMRPTCDSEDCEYYGLGSRSLLGKGSQQYLSTQTSAKLTRAAYIYGDSYGDKATRKRDVNSFIGEEGFKLLPRFSGRQLSVFGRTLPGGGTHIHIAHKGTQPTSVTGLRDIVSDVRIAMGTAMFDSQFNERLQKSEQVVRTYNPQVLTMSGHSLGGATMNDSIVRSKLLRGRVDQADSFDAGASPFFSNTMTALLKKGDKERLEDVMTHHRMRHDAVSKGLNYSKPPGDVLTYKLSTGDVKIDPDTGEPIEDMSRHDIKKMDPATKALHAHDMEHFFKENLKVVNSEAPKQEGSGNYEVYQPGFKVEGKGEVYQPGFKVKGKGDGEDAIEVEQGVDLDSQFDAFKEKAESMGLAPKMDGSGSKKRSSDELDEDWEKVAKVVKKPKTQEGGTKRRITPTQVDVTSEDRLYGCVKGCLDANRHERMGIEGGAPSTVPADPEQAYVPPTSDTGSSSVPLDNMIHIYPNADGVYLIQMIDSPIDGVPTGSMSHAEEMMLRLIARRDPLDEDELKDFIRGLNGGVAAQYIVGTETITALNNLWVDRATGHLIGGSKGNPFKSFKKNVAPTTQKQDTKTITGPGQTGDKNYDTARRIDAIDRTINRSSQPTGVQLIGKQVGFEPSVGYNPADIVMDPVSLGFDLASNRSDRYKAGKIGGYLGKNVGATAGEAVAGDVGAAVGAQVGSYWGQRGSKALYDARKPIKHFGSSYAKAGKKVGKKLKNLFK